MHLICLVICCDCLHLASLFVHAEGIIGFSCTHCYHVVGNGQSGLLSKAGTSDYTSVGTICLNFLKLFSGVSRIYLCTLF
jgi:hypothetical protein